MTDQIRLSAFAPISTSDHNAITPIAQTATIASEESVIIAAPVWHVCRHCPSTPTFPSTSEFIRHLQDKHCTHLDDDLKDSKSYVCRVGAGGTCSVAFNQQTTLPHNCDNINDSVLYSAEDTFEQHVLRHHLSPIVNRKLSTASRRNIRNGSQESTYTYGQADDNISTLDWTIYSSVQILPAVLNDPSRGKQSNLFTKKWGDSFVEKANIPASIHLSDVQYENMRVYLEKIGKRFKRHQRFLKSDISPKTSTFASNASGSLSDIPTIFLQQQLALNDPDIFTKVFPGIACRRLTGSSSDAAPDTSTAARVRLELQERLTHYLDIVEVHITRKVSAQSGAFFAAMTSQHTIMAEMHAAMLNVRRMREQLANADTGTVREALTICALQRRQQRSANVVHKLKIMSEVHKTQPMIQFLLGTADYVAAIDLIASTQELLTRELRDIHCVKHLPSQLHEMELLIDKMLRTEFERFATADLNRRNYISHTDESVPDRATSDMRIDGEDKLACILWGLLRQRNFAFIEIYRDESIATIRALMKEMLIGLLAAGDKECCLTGDGEESQSLSIAEWIELLEHSTKHLLHLLRRIRAFIGIIQKIAAQSAGHLADTEAAFSQPDGAFLTVSEWHNIDGRLADLMHTICNYCHERCATLISSQSLEQNVASASQMEQLRTIVQVFCAGCDSLQRGLGETAAFSDHQETNGETSDQRVCLPLLSALKTQATRFAQKFHADRKAKVALILDNERWRQSDVPDEIQRLAQRIATGQWNTLPDKCAERSGEQSTSGSLHLPNGDTFVLVGSALILIQIIDEYARCALQFPFIAIQLSRHVIDLLRTFNSRCCQLILGAGALRVAGLKKITSANLALVARALQLVVWMLPYIRDFFQSIDPSGSAKITPTITAPPINPAGYDIVERDLLSHITEIENMILSIVSQLLTAQIDAWTARPPVPSQSFRNICRHFLKLHEAIAPIMPNAHVRNIFAVIHRSFKNKLREQLVLHGVTNNGGPAHGVVTSELTFYAENLRTIGVFGDVSDELSDESMMDVWLK